MCELKSYDYLKTLSDEIFALSQTENDINILYNSIWSYVPELIGFLKVDLFNLLEINFYVYETLIYYNDPTYNQSVFSIIFHLKPDVNDNFAIKIECLVDHSGVNINVKERSCKYDELANKLVSHYMKNDYLRLKDL